ncbi:MAG: PEP-CTERM sorting domain-containing protein [Rhizomicrobium sp.]
MRRLRCHRATGRFRPRADIREPATLAPFGAGLAGAAAMRRRKWRPYARQGARL